MFSTYIQQFHFTKRDIETLTNTMQCSQSHIKKILSAKRKPKPDAMLTILTYCAQKGGGAHAALSSPEEGKWFVVYPVQRTVDEQRAATQAACAAVLKFKCRPQGNP